MLTQQAVIPGGAYLLSKDARWPLVRYWTPPPLSWLLFPISDLKEWTGHPLSHLTSLAENRPGWITLVDSLVAPTAGQTAMGPVSGGRDAQARLWIVHAYSGPCLGQIYVQGYVETIHNRA
ncbi:hypothetical protein Bbelb_386100 [Branchiostoma belcheri]|nr:hypothetical protein Bbelb_386100 [Branchiostoma belcheri]